MEYNDSEFNLNNFLIKIDASTKSKHRHLRFVWIVYVGIKWIQVLNLILIFLIYTSLP